MKKLKMNNLKLKIKENYNLQTVPLFYIYHWSFYIYPRSFYIL